MFIESCKVKYYIEALVPGCEDDYSSSEEERRSFLPGWIYNETISIENSSIDNAFVYRSGDQLDSYIYFGQHAIYSSGGYVYEFRGSLNELRHDLSTLRRLTWIDKQTRAVLIQMNMYNPNVPIFTSSMIIVEILPSSGVYPSARFEPLDFDGKSDESSRRSST
jgi:polycystin 1L2